MIRNYAGSIKRTLKNRSYYSKKRKYVLSFFKEFGYNRVKPFNLDKWHHDLDLFTAFDKLGDEVFIKFTKLERLLKNENRAYKIMQQNTVLKNHIIEHKEYIKSKGFRALVLKLSKGIVLNEDWMVNNIEKLGALIRIVDEFKNLSLVHRDLKLDNFIYEDGNIKIFDFSFMIDKTERRKPKEIDLKSRENILKLVNLGMYYKPEPLKWDDYYSLYIIFNNLLKNKSLILSLEQKDILSRHAEECKGKIDTNSYTILK
ncbi:hypothetical protein [uncultured Maribacter sp.]|uniref:hypothetical protein n=1 Tax=uncultured Maribacter sp. TaxID=431308 RepID=UPI0030EBAD51|tara:strand:+ start:78775 stop:79548 length:774 start_codon:yes stop_codon:yes gene_type:complete